MQYHHLSYEALRNFCIEVFKGYKFTEEESKQIAEKMISGTLEKCSLSAQCFKYDALLRVDKKYYENIIFNQPSQGVFKEGWDNRLKFLENSANKMVESGFYIPPYYNEITPFDEGYEGPLISRTNADNKMALRNKYQYNLNKAKSLQINTQTKDVSNLSKSPSKPLDFDEWLDELKRKRRKGL